MLIFSSSQISENTIKLKINKFFVVLQEEKTALTCHLLGKYPQIAARKAEKRTRIKILIYFDKKMNSPWWSVVF